MDFLIVSLKYGALPGALESIKKVVGKDTIVMSLMNGVDSEEIIAEQIGKSHILPAVIKVASHREADGYHFDPETTLGIIFGEYEAPYESEKSKSCERIVCLVPESITVRRNMR